MSGLQSIHFEPDLNAYVIVVPAENLRFKPTSMKPDAKTGGQVPVTNKYFRIATTGVAQDAVDAATGEQVKVQVNIFGAGDKRPAIRKEWREAQKGK